MVIRVRVLSVLVYEAVFTSRAICACVLGAGVYDCGEFWRVYDVRGADGSAAWTSGVKGEERMADRGWSASFFLNYMDDTSWSKEALWRWEH
jgi:hypothetical protein